MHLLNKYDGDACTKVMYHGEYETGYILIDNVHDAQETLGLVRQWATRALQAVQPIPEMPFVYAHTEEESRIARRFVYGDVMDELHARMYRVPLIDGGVDYQAAAWVHANVYIHPPYKPGISIPKRLRGDDPVSADVSEWYMAHPLPDDVEHAVITDVRIMKDLHEIGGDFYTSYKAVFIMDLYGGLWKRVMGEDVYSGYHEVCDLGYDSEWTPGLSRLAEILVGCGLPPVITKASDLDACVGKSFDYDARVEGMRYDRLIDRGEDTNAA